MLSPALSMSSPAPLIVLQPKTEVAKKKTVRINKIVFFISFSWIVPVAVCFKFRRVIFSCFQLNNRIYSQKEQWAVTTFNWLLSPIHRMIKVWFFSIGQDGTGNDYEVRIGMGLSDEFRMWILSGVRSSRRQTLRIYLIFQKNRYWGLKTHSALHQPAFSEQLMRGEACQQSDGCNTDPGAYESFLSAVLQEHGPDGFIEMVWRHQRRDISQFLRHVGQRGRQQQRQVEKNAQRPCAGLGPAQ